MSTEERKSKDFGPRNFDGRRRKIAPLDPDTAKRQGLIVRLAFVLLGGRDNAMAFLNAHHSELGGRPLDLAMENAAGYAMVEEAMRKTLSPPTVS